MIVQTMVLGEIKTNTYVAYDETSNECVIIDPAAEPNRIIAFINEHHLSVKAIFVTHGHFDHIGAVDTLQQEFQCPVYTSQAESELMADSIQNLSAYFNTKTIATATNTVAHDEYLTLSPTLTFKIILVPGHSPESVCYYNEKNQIVFTGDTLMEGRIGRTDYYYGGSHELVEYIKSRLMVLPEATTLYPGHGHPSTIGHEYHHNHYFGKSMWL